MSSPFAPFSMSSNQDLPSISLALGQWTPTQMYQLELPPIQPESLMFMDFKRSFESPEWIKYTLFDQLSDWLVEARPFIAPIVLGGVAVAAGSLFDHEWSLRYRFRIGARVDPRAILEEYRHAVEPIKAICTRELENYEHLAPVQEDYYVILELTVAAYEAGIEQMCPRA